MKNRDEKISFLKEIHAGTRRLKKTVDHEACSTDDLSRLVKIIERYQHQNIEPTAEESAFIESLPTKNEFSA